MTMADLDGIDIPRTRNKAASKKTSAKKTAPKTAEAVSFGEAKTSMKRTTALQGGSAMDWGMRNRLSRIFKPDTGRTVMLAVDHGYFLGPTTGLEDLGATVEPLLPYADALMPTRGGIRHCVNPSLAQGTPICLRVSGGNSILGELSDEDITVAMEDAIRLNVSAVALSIYVGSEYQHRTLKNLTRLVDKGERYGIPVLAVTAVGKDMVRDARYLALASRIAAELGAHAVKTYYCKDFERVVNTCPVPIVMAGGKKLPEDEALKLTNNAIKRGASGVDMGRNIFQSDDPVAMIQAVRAVVHQNMSPQKALALYQDLKRSNKRKKK
jgi:putative autoinducer-2 (AI-2) aldolase